MKKPSLFVMSVPTAFFILLLFSSTKVSSLSLLSTYCSSSSFTSVRKPTPKTQTANMMMRKTTYWKLQKTTTTTTTTRRKSITLHFSSSHEQQQQQHDNESGNDSIDKNYIVDKEVDEQLPSSSPSLSLSLSNNSHNHSNDKNTNNTSNTSILLLNFVAIIWGTQHSIIKMTIEDCDTSIFTLIRFSLAAFIASIGLIVSNNNNVQVNYSDVGIGIVTDTIDDNITGKDSDRGKDDDGDMMLPKHNRSSYMNSSDDMAWKWGIEMGLWMLLGYAFQAIGLEYTTAQRSGFLLYLNIKFVPLFAFIIYQRKISLATWISALTALSGTALLTFDGSNYDFNIGDGWSIAAAAASAMFILRLEFASKEVANIAKLNTYSLSIVTFGALIWCLVDGIIAQQAYNNGELMMVITSSVQSIWDKIGETISLHPLELIYLGGVSTALANYIQTKAQRGISAERASIIYALDPVYGAFFAFELLGEQLSQYGIVGASLITIAAATNAFLDLGDTET